MRLFLEMKKGRACESISSIHRKGVVRLSGESLILSADSLHIVGRAARLMSRKLTLGLSSCMNREEAPSVPG